MADDDPVEDSGGEYTVRQRENAGADMDPSLLNILLSLESDEGEEFIPDKVRASGYVEVIAQLADPDASVDGLTVAQKIGDIVTGTVLLQKIRAVHGHPNVVRLELARKLSPSLDRSVFEIRAHPEQFREAQPAGADPFDGSDVVVGFVDYDCDFAHPNFCMQGEDGGKVTRLLFLWDQRRVVPTAPSVEYPNGREFSAQHINDALKLPRCEAYKQLQYKPDDDAHGTHVMDVAVGNGRGTCHRGVAPRADIIFVHLETEDDIETFGSSGRLLEAVKYIFDKAAGKPAVVNISLNGRDGPHDGSTLAEKAFDELLRAPGRAIVIAAGNWRDKKGHASGVAETGSHRPLRWEIQRDDRTNNEVEVWYGGAYELELSLRTPGEILLGPFNLSTVSSIHQGETEVARITHGESYTSNRDHLITLNLSTDAEPGNWTLLLRSLSTEPITFHAWIAGDPRGQSTFGPADVVSSHTVGSISCGASTLVVGSYDPLKPQPAEPDSSAGPTRDGKLKPEVSAPGRQINVAMSQLDIVTEPRSGTSIAAPHVAGMVALMMHAARPHGLTTEQIRSAVIDSARKPPPHTQDWEPRYGYGRADALSAALTRRQSTPSPNCRNAEGGNLMDFNFNFNVPPERLGQTSRSTSTEPVEHPPIVITDGSASVEFDAELYRLPAGTETHVSSGLFLEKIRVLNKRTQTWHFCRSLTANERCKVVVTSVNDATTKTFTIIGANRDTGGSPTINFDHAEFQEVVSENPKARKHFNDRFNVTKVEVFTVAEDGSTTLVHTCPLVPSDGSGKCKVTIFDPHVRDRT